MDRQNKRRIPDYTGTSNVTSVVKITIFLITLVVTSEILAVPKTLQNSLPADIDEIPQDSVELIKQAASRGSLRRNTC
jgi:hypothetical protein